MKKLSLLALAALATTSVPAVADTYWTVDAKVIRVEASYAPNALPFQLNQAAGTCPAGSWLQWAPQGADATARAQNYQAVLALLLTAKATGQQVTAIGSNGSCTLTYIHLS